MVHIIAHELRHHWQHVTKFAETMGYRYSPSYYSKAEFKKLRLEQEKDAERYAVNQVRRWRRLNFLKDYCNVPDWMVPKKLG